MEAQSQKRIIWIDCFKVLTICLMVIGHITGKYNAFIYQFHIAAFFWLSGYCINWSRVSKKELVWNRLCRLILPLLVFFIIGVFGMWCLHITNTYDILWGELEYIGVAKMMSEFLLHHNIYVWWLGQHGLLLLYLKSRWFMQY